MPVDTTNIPAFLSNNRDGTRGSSSINFIVLYKIKKEKGDNIDNRIINKGAVNLPPVMGGSIFRVLLFRHNAHTW